LMPASAVDANRTIDQSCDIYFDLL
jgi:hypothetical protein